GLPDALDDPRAPSVGPRYRRPVAVRLRPGPRPTGPLRRRRRRHPGFRRPRRAGAAVRGQHRRHRRAALRGPDPARAARHPLRAAVPRALPRPPPGNGGRRLRLRDRPERLRRHQQPRGRQREPGGGVPARRVGTHGAGGRHGRADRPRPAADRDRPPAPRRALGLLGAGARGLLGAGGGQPLRPRRQRHHRHHLGAGAGDRRRALRRLHPDGRRHQPRQLRRAAVQHGGRGDRHFNGHLLALRRQRRHRLRHALRPGAAGGGPAPARRAGGARLAGRFGAGRGAGGRARRRRQRRPARRAGGGRGAQQPRQPRRAAPGRPGGRHERRADQHLPRPGPQRRRPAAGADDALDRAAGRTRTRIAGTGGPPARHAGPGL
ncbi:MAG: HtrA protease/chaperone protein, partial [uncultured Acetobacteraceae bacterium]